MREWVRAYMHICALQVPHVARLLSCKQHHECMLRVQKTSTEPERKTPYSINLRHRMLWQKIGMGLTFRGVARNLNVAVGTVHNVLRRLKKQARLIQNIQMKNY